MKLTIDTTADSKEDLQRVIHFLHLVVDDHVPEAKARAEIFNDSKSDTPASEPASPLAMNDFFSMTGTSGSQPETEPESMPQARAPTPHSSANDLLNTIGNVNDLAPKAQELLRQAQEEKEKAQHDGLEFF